MVDVLGGCLVLEGGDGRVIGTSRNEAVADIADRADEGLMFRTEFGAQPSHVDIDGACSAEVVITPDLRQQLRSGEDTSGMLGEEPQ